MTVKLTPAAVKKPTPALPGPVACGRRKRMICTRSTSILGIRSAKLAFVKLLFAKFYNFLAGSFSAASKRNFARKYAFGSIFQALQDLHTFAPLQSQDFFSRASDERIRARAPERIFSCEILF